MSYVLVAVVVPIALMCAMLIMERLERRVLGAPVHADDGRGGTPAPAVPQPSAPHPLATEHTVVTESPRAA